MSRVRAAEHLKEGLPWMLGATASCLYFMDAFQNEGRAASAVSDWIQGAADTSKSTLRSSMNPALELIESMEKGVLEHTDDEKFLNKPMEDQMNALVEWFQEGDLERGLHYLALFAKDRGSPQTDWPVNEYIIRQDLLEKIVEVRHNGKMTPGLFGASLAALCQAPENARFMLRQNMVDHMVKSLQDSSNSEVDTIFNLKALVLVGIHQPRSGEFEKMLVQSRTAIPHLMSILQDDADTVFEARYPSQLLSCILRCYPEVLSSEMNGKYNDADGLPMTVFSVIKEGCRFKETWSLQYYVRLARDCFVADPDVAMAGFQSVEFTPLLVGLLQNNWGYLELLPSVARLLKLMTHASPEPGKLLAYTDFLIIASTVVEKAGPYHHGLVLELQQTVDMAVLDATLPPEFIATKRAVLERFRRSCKNVLSKPTTPHVTKGWLERDHEAAEQKRVVSI
eukprot:TRINITY_DN9519_c0_g1_i1.p1 TRINITY_DN9519_c0_g1~~TRINITY_DN9519_c0_g1_i1.p1  ORF type:complete len:452 (+),score=64.25 TRINITY_DN9519_c0_g1_i1:70-1425(+)